MSGVIVCYQKCWACNFDSHPGGPHTWMDEDDIEASSEVEAPKMPEDWQRLAVSWPCGCWCYKRAADE